MVDVALGVLDAQAVEHLLVRARAEGGDGEHLGLAAGEEGGAVGAGQHADLDGDVADVARAAPVGALAALENGADALLL